jgi:hypothetical protein
LRLFIGSRAKNNTASRRAARSSRAQSLPTLGRCSAIGAGKRRRASFNRSLAEDERVPNSGEPVRSPTRANCFGSVRHGFPGLGKIVIRSVGGGMEKTR